MSIATMTATTHYTVTIQTRGGPIPFHRQGDDAAGKTAQHFRLLGYPTVVTDVHGTEVELDGPILTIAEHAHYERMAAQAQTEDVYA